MPIVKIDGICGGEPHIKGTRISVRCIVEYIRIYNSIDRILQALPHLTRDDVEEALDYYGTHKDEIEELIAENVEENEESWKDIPNLFNWTAPP